MVHNFMCYLLLILYYTFFFFSFINFWYFFTSSAAYSSVYTPLLHLLSTSDILVLCYQLLWYSTILILLLIIPILHPPYLGYIYHWCSATSFIALLLHISTADTVSTWFVIYCWYSNAISTTFGLLMAIATSSTILLHNASVVLVFPTSFPMPMLC